MDKKSKKSPRKSKKAKRNFPQPAKEEKNKWQEFLRRHSKARERKK